MPKNQKRPNILHDYHKHRSYRTTFLADVEERLQLDDELPLVVGDLLAVEFLQAVDALAGDLAVKGVLLLEMAAVGGLVAAHFDLDGD